MIDDGKALEATRFLLADSVQCTLSGVNVDQKQHGSGWGSEFCYQRGRCYLYVSILVRTWRLSKINNNKKISQ